MPGLFPCAAGNSNPTENKRGKQGRSIYTPVKRLLGTGTQTPEKGRHRQSFSTPLTGRLRVLPDASIHETYSQPVKSLYSVPARVRSRSTCGAFCKATRAALAGGLGVAPNKQIFHFFAGAKKWKIAKCVPLCIAWHSSERLKGKYALYQ